MNRRNFFRSLGAATVGVIVAPVVVAKAVEGIPAFDANKIDERIKDINEKYICMDVSNLDKYDINGVLKMWRENGILLYKPPEQKEIKLYVDGNRIKEWKQLKKKPQPYNRVL